MPNLSVCIISYNEERRIRACLESVKGIADEIVLVDSCSTDRTRDIAAEFTNRVIEQPFLGYIEQKNFAVAQASHDWILSLDCDECLSNELRASIIEIKPLLDPRTVYRVSRKTFYVYRWLDHCWRPDWKVRLFHRAHAKWGGVNPHDRVVADTELAIELRGPLLHYTVDSISGHLQNVDRFTEIAAREAFAAGKRATVVDPVLHGLFSFVKQYLLKRGFLDGFAGLSVAVISGLAGFAKYAKLWIMARQDPPRDPTP